MRAISMLVKLLVLLQTLAQAQTSKNPFSQTNKQLVQTYTVGDKVPELEFRNLVNYSKNEYQHR